ncbi:Heat shock 70 kDa protein 12B [Geodia barretti]|nr:Heat shock 70 kDa protein 12B [Geodia barretti]
MRKRGQVAYPTPHPNSTPSTPTSYSYLIVDIGGGTVDVSAHRVSTTPTLSVEELHHPDGNDWGGLQVNLKFSEFLQKLVGDRRFSRYLQVNDADAKILNRFDVDELMNVTFERVKKAYCRSPRDEREEVFVKLPDSFLQEYGEALVASLEAKTKELRMEGRENEIVTLRDSILRIPPSKMEQFLQPAVDGITECIDGLLATLSNTGVEINTIYLVGGFGGCHYIYELFTERYGEGRGIIVPPNPEFAIVEGAVLFRANPGIVRSRKADATYGKSVVRHFESFHDPRYRQGDHCHNLFQTIVGRGESIRPDCLYMAVSRPLSLDQKRMHFEVFSSVKKAEELWYTRDEGVVQIGELVLELPEVGRTTRDREVKVFFDFSHTEIQVRACEKSSKAEVKAVLDFLSAIPPGQRRKVKVQEERVEERDGDQKHEDEEENNEGERGVERGDGELCDLNA